MPPAYNGTGAGDPDTNMAGANGIRTAVFFCCKTARVIHASGFQVLQTDSLFHFKKKTGIYGRLIHS